jgi:MSHA biogenesis protein MshI
VTDIVADGVALPNSSKIQAYVVNKSIINDLVKCCLKSGLELGNVVPEEEVWAHAQNELTSFMLLHRAKQEHFKIAAFHESSTAFQRSIRTVMAPITNTPSAALQYDGLALELQRSIDYLSSTFKQAHFGKLFILCDEEDQTLLAQELQERVSVQVVTLQQDQQTYAEVLASLTKPESTDEINLYPEHLKPKVDYFTLKNVVVTWAVLSTLLLGTFGVYSFQLSLLNEQLGQLSRESEALSAKQASLQQQVAKHVPTQEKLNAVARIKQDIENKQASLKAVGQFDDSQKLGYSGVMTSLSILGRNDISLSDIYIDSDNLNMSGLASRPQAVPNWINQFKKEHNLVGRTFETLTLGRNEDDIVTFELRAKLEKN